MGGADAAHFAIALGPDIPQRPCLVAATDLPGVLRNEWRYLMVSHPTSLALRVPSGLALATTTTALNDGSRLCGMSASTTATWLDM